MLETSLGNGNGSAVVRKGAVGGVVGAEPDKVFLEGAVMWVLDSSIIRGHYSQLLQCFGISEENQPKVGAKLGLGQAGVVPEGLLLLQGYTIPQLSTIMINSSPT